MRKYFLLLLLICQLFTFSQDVDSLKIESLKKQLPLLHDTARINCLLDIAVEYSFWGKDGGDSTKFYVSIANKESIQKGYKYGIAYSLLFSAGNEIFVTKDLAAAEKLIKQALALGEEINNPKILGKTYSVWGEIFIRRKDPELVNIYKKALRYFQLAGDEEGQAEASNWICGICLEKGQYEEGFNYCKESVRLSLKKRNHTISWGYFLVQYSLNNMAELYKAAGDYETAMTYLREMDKFGKEHKGAGWTMTALMAEVFCKMNQYDSAQIYMEKWAKEGEATNPETSAGHKAWARGVQGQIYLSTHQYDKAIEIFRNSIDTLKKHHNLGIYAAIRFLIFLGQSYEGEKNYNTALQYAKQGLNLAIEKNQRPEMMQGYQALSSIYHNMGRNDSAYEYIIKYQILKDSIQTNQFLLRIHNSKKEAEEEQRTGVIRLLNKDNQLKKAELKQQAFVRNSLLGGLLLICFIAVFVFRILFLKRKNEKLRAMQLEKELKMQQLESKQKHIELQRQAIELEMQALRAQMNPHFIFNCLSSINKFILKNESQAASDYLTRFSRLIRRVLTNSQLSLIPLSDEIEMLKLYLDMERLRFDNSFDYNIVYANTIEPETIYIPPMLLQPFCENAIWHGLMHKEGQGKLDIELSTQNGQLDCVIADNGIGRSKATQLKSKSGEKQKSFGLKITSERLALFNNDQDRQSYYRTEDIYDNHGKVAGTRVKLVIKYKDAIHDLVNGPV